MNPSRKLSRPLRFGLYAGSVLLLICIPALVLTYPLQVLEEDSPSHRYHIRVTCPVELGKLLPIWHPQEIVVYFTDSAIGKTTRVDSIYSGNQGIADTVDCTPTRIVWDKKEKWFCIETSETLEPSFTPKAGEIAYDLIDEPPGVKQAYHHINY